MEAGMIAARKAIEALRAGVPNREAIRQLGTGTVSLSQDFTARLALCATAANTNEQIDGLGIAGQFGAGKSHELGYLAELAQRENFIVSLVPISKETPLFDPGRLFAAAMRVAIVPGRNDDAMTAVIGALRPDTDLHDRLENWVDFEVGRERLSPLFAALLHVLPRVDAEDQARIGRFFSGARLNVSVVKGWLRGAGAAKLFNVTPVR